MFWDAVGHGLSVLLHWQTYVVLLEYMVIVLIPQLFFSWLLMRQESGATATVGCFVMPVVLTLFQLIAVFIVVCTLAPLILGRPEGAVWQLPWALISQEPGVAIRVMALMFAFGEPLIYGDSNCRQRSPAVAWVLVLDRDLDRDRCAWVACADPVGTSQPPLRLAIQGRRAWPCLPSRSFW